MGYPRGVSRVRYVTGLGFEMQCQSCRIYVALVEEEWVPKSGLTRCKTCWREYKRLREAGRLANEITAELKRTNARLRYRFNKPAQLAAAKAWRDANKERVAAYNKAYRESHRAEVLAQSRAYYSECRDVILTKKRQAYAENAA